MARSSNMYNIYIYIFLDSDLVILALIQGKDFANRTWLLRGTTLPSAIPIPMSNMHAIPLKLRAGTLANRHGSSPNERSTYPILARSPLFESPASTSARMERPGAARCSRDSSRSVQQLPTLGSRVCEYLLLSFSASYSLPRRSRLSLFSSAGTRLQHPSPFHSRVPASRPRTNPCARIMIRDCVSEGGEEAKSAFVCGSLFLFPSLFFF